MSDQKLNRIVAFGVFLAALVVYLKTMSVTVVFWDVGEFIAASRLLQVPHPPGSPLFVLVGRLASMVPIYADIAARVHAISAVASALGVALLYLVAVKVITRFHPLQSTVDRITVYGASVIGSLALAFSTTYWDNSIEAEVYGVSMLFVALIVWLALRWWDKADEPHNEKYMLLIAYLIGLSVGVHLLAVLAVFPVLMLVYFRRYEANKQSLIRFLVVALAIFFIIYPGVVQYLPSMLDGEFKNVRNDFIKFIPLLSILLAAYGVYRARKTNQKMLQVACLSFLLIVLGYTTYAVVLIRANVPNIPMNENDPSNLASLTSYLGREQYGDTPLLKGESWDNGLQDFREKLFPRRYSAEPMHNATRVNYTSDGDFMWRYQINHMFIRYLLWNYVGAEGDWQDAGVSWKHTWGIPFLVGLLGLFYHFKRENRTWWVFMAMFIIMGVVLALYQNQQDPQPRERDYFYVGAYYVMALWIAIGLVAIVSFIRERLASSASTIVPVVAGVMAIGAVAIPINLARVNWHEHDRSQNYIAWDYSYNLLQSCEPNGILFTNGDNDTFPVWYLQDVDGVRRDVRVVNLSLVNTPWYISQLKNQRPHGALPVPISLTDKQIEQIRPILWNPRTLELPVSSDIVSRYRSQDRPTQTGVSMTDSALIRAGKISFTMNGMQIRPDTRILRVQDIMVRDIIMSNKWERPIHFAVTVAPDSKIGLDDYMWMQGLAWKLKPFKVSEAESDIGGIDRPVMGQNVLAMDVVPSKEPQHGYLYRNLNNPNVYYDENAQRLVMNYRAAFLRLAAYDMRVRNDRDSARHIMAQMNDIIPPDVIPVQDWAFAAQIMTIYSSLGDDERAEIYAKQVEEECNKLIASGQFDPNSYYNPYRFLLEIYDMRKDYASAIGLLNRLGAMYPQDQSIKSRIQFYEQQLRTSSPHADTSKQPTGG